MRFNDDEEDEFEDENEEDEDEQIIQDDDDDAEADGDGDGDDEEAEADPDGSTDDEGEAPGEDDEEEEDAEADEEDEEEDGDEDEDEDDDGDNDGDEDEDGEDGDGDEADVDMDRDGSTAATPTPLRPTPLRSLSPSRRPPPPHIIRRNQFLPAYTTPPNALTLEAIVAIPLPSAVHAIASTACSSYLLAGGQEGYVRAYDFYASLNGQQLMTSQQRVQVGMGDTITKAGVARGWWGNEVPDEDDLPPHDGPLATGNQGQAQANGTHPNGDAANGHAGGQAERRIEPVFSLAVQGDGLWALAGSQSGPVSLTSLRHAPGTLIHTLRGHSSVVSALTLRPDETGFISGSWDGSIREWDLNTGDIVQMYPTHGAQISSLALRPPSSFASPPTPPRPAADPDSDPREGGEGEGDEMKVDVSVNVGPGFFVADRPVAESAAGSETPATDGPTEVKQEANGTTPKAVTPPAEAATGADGRMEVDQPAGRASRASSTDGLFDDDDDADADPDAEGETVPPSGVPTARNTPGPTSNVNPGLALPGQMRPPPLALPLASQRQSSPPAMQSSTASTPLTSSFALPHRVAARSDAIPLLTPTTFKHLSNDVLLASFMDGQVELVDRRVPDYSDGRGVGRLLTADKTPPWCMSACWSGDGNQVFAGRRNGTMDIWDVRRGSSSTAPNLLRTLRTPTESGAMSCIVAFPDGKHIATASQDNVRLWNTTEYYEADDSIAALGAGGVKRSKSRPPFKIIAGHHGGIVSNMLIDPTSRFLTVASGDRGWQGESTKVILVHEVKW